MVVSAKGYHPETRQVTIEAGKAMELTVDLSTADDAPPS